MTREPIGREPLWSDDKIGSAIDAMAQDVFHENRIRGMVGSSQTEVFALTLRDDYQAELATARARIAELEALLEGHRAAATEWVPVPDDIYNTDGPEVIYVKGQLLSIVGETYVYLPANMRLCRRVATGEATP